VDNSASRFNNGLSSGDFKMSIEIDQLIRMLEQTNAGEVIIRLTSKGKDITISVKEHNEDPEED
jgi:hypothetical protein